MVVGLICAGVPARGAATPSPADHGLDPITVVASGLHEVNAASAGDVGREQIAGEPLLRPAALLENVPGLIVTQHSGEGKANQYFLRAFNLDHGTDLAVAVDDMPVNMPSHAHGQGYADLNFLIPELAADLHYKKGAYYADEGDFATAGSVRVELVNQIPDTVSVGVGQDGYRRALALGSGAFGGGELLAAAELYRNDGPFDVSDDYHRANGVLRYSRGDAHDALTVTAMTYHGTWTSTDQVPQRAVEQGIIDRFGSLNPSDGGDSTRTSVSVNRVHRGDRDEVDFSAYVMHYRLDLWSTFTGFLRDPVNGDQMLQHDDRMIYGFKASRTWATTAAGFAVSNVIGVQSRIDDIRDVGIFASIDRRVLGTTQQAGVTEANAGAFAQSTVQWSDAVRTVVGLRGDEFAFNVRDKLQSAGVCSLATDPLGCDSGRRRAGIVSPKLALVLGPWHELSYFINLGDGFHSNDARGITRSGENSAQTPVTPLTRAISAEAGMAGAVTPRWTSTFDVFVLKLKSELVFSGDAGVTEPNGATTRTGVEWGNSYHATEWLSADLNATLARARFDANSAPDDLGCGGAAASHPCGVPVAIRGRYVPNSPTNVVDAGLMAKRLGWFGALRARHFGSSPLVEDNGAKSPAYTTVDLKFGYRHSDRWTAAVDVFNVADVKWNDIEYYYVSRLKSEPAPLADYVVHPGVPRTVRARVDFQF